MTISLDKKYKTRNGLDVSLVRIFENPSIKYAVHGNIFFSGHAYGSLNSWTREGLFLESAPPQILNPLDLIEVTENEVKENEMREYEIPKYVLTEKGILPVAGEAILSDGTHMGLICRQKKVGGLGEEYVVIENYDDLVEISPAELIMKQDEAIVVKNKMFSTPVYRHFSHICISGDNPVNYVAVYEAGCTSHTTTEVEQYATSTHQFFKFVEE
jgi:hypothetical protein